MDSRVCINFSEFFDGVCAQGMKNLECMAAIQLQLQTFTEKYRNVCRELERERAANRDAQERANLLESDVKRLKEAADPGASVARLELERERAAKERSGLLDNVKTLKKAVDQNAFILVLIDADADEYLFDEKYYHGDPAEGGKRAALDLRVAVREYIKKTKPHLTGFPIIVKAFASGHRLAESLTKARAFRVDNAKNGVFRFAAGFSEADDQFDFVLVGLENDRGNHKITSTFRHFAESPCCKHVVLGACHDNGYVRMLEKHVLNLEFVEKVTLLKSFQTAVDFASLPFTFTTMDSSPEKFDSGVNDFTHGREEGFIARLLVTCSPQRR
ncbi:hypothetical protein QQZ08_003165 [Neonectria magnoliae]|uniref:DUF7923 domain-containing protein n=1 Tax=Neonectria magnoliae TaxID=2732573 RepID=A0ABR1IA48_9HYPO